MANLQLLHSKDYPVSLQLAAVVVSPGLFLLHPIGCEDSAKRGRAFPATASLLAAIRPLLPR